MAMDLTKLRGLGPAELAKEEEASRAEVWKLRLQMKTGQLQDPFKVRKARKQLARILTVMREQQLAAKAGEQK